MQTLHMRIDGSYTDRGVKQRSDEKRDNESFICNPLCLPVRKLATYMANKLMEEAW